MRRIIAIVLKVSPQDDMTPDQVNEISGRTRSNLLSLTSCEDNDGGVWREDRRGAHLMISQNAECVIAIDTNSYSGPGIMGNAPERSGPKGKSWNCKHQFAADKRMTKKAVCMETRT
jgi:hypothetical protein